jgi:hypothetical protein
MAAPWLAACIHSAIVFHSGIRFYNAELWRLADARTLTDILAWVGIFGAPGAITFLILLPFRKSKRLQWVFWICSVLFWLEILIQMEIAFH